MEKKDFKNKHDHKLTNWIKVIIFSILMMAPFFSIATRCLYVICNKNAKESYSNFNANADQYENLDSYSDLVVGRQYKMITDNNTTAMQSGNTGRMNVENVHVISITSNMSQYINDIESSTYIAIWYTPNYNSAFLKFENANTNFSLLSTYVECTFTYMSLSNVNQTNDFSYYFGTNMYFVNHINQTNTLDNAFDYSISQLQQSPTFSWTTQTATYDVFNNMLTGLTIQNGILPLLLTYWMMLIVVYIIVDIIIKTFTFITHLIAQ